MDEEQGTFVVTLELPRIELPGCPGQLFFRDLTRLRTLRLQGNKLRGPLASAIGKVHTLQVFSK